MKKFLFVIAIAATAIIISCNDPKDPPDDGFIERLRAEQKRVSDSTAKAQLITKQ